MTSEDIVGFVGEAVAILMKPLGNSTSPKLMKLSKDRFLESMLVVQNSMTGE